MQLCVIYMYQRTMFPQNMASSYTIQLKSRITIEVFRSYNIAAQIYIIMMIFHDDEADATKNIKVWWALEIPLHI